MQRELINPFSPIIPVLYDIQSKMLLSAHKTDHILKKRGSISVKENTLQGQYFPWEYPGPPLRIFRDTREESKFQALQLTGQSGWNRVVSNTSFVRSTRSSLHFNVAHITVWDFHSTQHQCHNTCFIEQNQEARRASRLDSNAVSLFTNIRE